MTAAARGGLAALLGLVVATGCGEKSRPKADENFHKPALERLAKAKLKVGEFSAVDKPETYGALGCRLGTVAALPVLLCQYASESEVKAAAEKRLAFVGEAVTGAERVDGRVVLVVSDPDKKDLRGVTIQAVLNAFKKVEPF